MIPQATIGRIREATDLVELISAYVRLKKRGQNFVGLCPFHTEKTPSFNVSPARQIYHCFGCGKGGDVFAFLMEHERMGFGEAAAYLAERAHIELPRSAGRSDDPSDRIYRAHAVALDYFQKALRHPEIGAPARDYLLARRITTDSVERFDLGYAPRRRRGLLRYAERHGLAPADLERAGLVFADGARLRDRFVDRLMFPVRNLSGKTVAFGGRDLGGHSRAKYLNSPESTVYQKGRMLYGLHEARRSIQEADEVLLCEGYFDLIRLHEHGFRQAVAASGTALTAEQARLLARYAARARLLFDADGPGMAAALRSVAVLYDAGMDVLVVRLGAGEDPDSFLLREGAPALTQRVAASVGYVAFLEERAGGSFAALSPGAQDRLIDQLASTIRRIDDPLRRDLVMRAAWSALGVSEAAFRGRVAATRRAEDSPAAVPAPRSERWHAELLRFLLLNPALRPEAAREMAPEEIADPLERRLLELLLKPEHASLEADALLPSVDAELAALIRTLASAEGPLQGAEFGDYLLKLKRSRLERRAQELLGRLRAAERRGDRPAEEELALLYRRSREEWLKLEKQRRQGGA